MAGVFAAGAVISAVCQWSTIEAADEIDNLWQNSRILQLTQSKHLNFKLKEAGLNVSKQCDRL
jgi:hypothetical protein